MKYCGILLIVAFGSASGIILRHDNMRNSDACAKSRCQDAGPIAERLGKLALLPDFVTQTLLLLEDLMKEMDKELQRTASYLINNIGTECPKTFNALQEVLQKQRFREGRKAAHVGFGVEPMHDNHEQTGPSTNVNSSPSYSPREDSSKFRPIKVTSEKDKPIYNPYEDQWQPNKHEPNPVYKESSTNKWSNPQYYPKENSPKKPNYSGGPYWKTEDTDKQDSSGHDSFKSDKIAGAQTDSYPQWREPRKQESISSGSNWKTEQSSGKWESQKKKDNLSKDLLGVGDGVEHYAESEDTKASCRGVDKTSAFWVPGLDAWCIQNCAVGYCPQTHCIC